MSNALTPAQQEVMRRVRDGTLWSKTPHVDQELNEVLFLCNVGLIARGDSPGIFDLTDEGAAYLNASEQRLE